MSLQDLSQHASAWLREPGPESDVVISSRVRLARNLAGFPFFGQATTLQRREVMQSCHQHILEADLAPDLMWIDLANAQSLDCQVLVERHLISRQHSQGRAPRGVAISGDESVAIMVNEEDHLRMQVLRSGMQLQEAYRQANQIDDTLEASLDFAYSPKLGYLTACPTNVGTGIRVSVMLHLPALKLTGEIEKVRRAARDLRLAVRGFYGEGTEAIGDFYQISNQTTLGRAEEEILDDFQNVIIPQIIDYEHQAREALADRRPALLDDKVYRALGTLTHARLLASEETLYLLSHLRLGLLLGRIREMNLRTVNALFLLTQPAHLQKMAGRTMEDHERREFRATLIRNRLAG